MIVFEITQGDEKQTYRCPETAEDVTILQYAEYSEKIAPGFPQELADLAITRNKAQGVWQTLEPWVKKAGIVLSTDWQDVVGDLNQWLATKAKDNAKLEVPELLAAYSVEMYKADELTGKMDSVWLLTKYYPFLVEVIAFFTGMDKPTVQRMSRQQMDYFYMNCMRAISHPSSIEAKQLYEHNGRSYTLPSELMRDSTLVEFAEAATFEKEYLAAKEGSARALYNMVCILLRPIGAAYSEEQYKENQESFKDLPLLVAYEVGFFLSRLSGKFALSFLTSIGATQAKRLAMN